MKRTTPLRLSILLSLLLHALFTALVWLAPSGSTHHLKKTDKSVTEVELIDAEALAERIRKQVPPSPRGQIVEQDKRVNDEIAKDARFLSKYDQKVIDETQAALHGKFKNSDESSGERSEERKLGKTSDEIAQTNSEERPKAEKEKVDPSKEFLTSDAGVEVKGKPKLKDLVPSFKPGPPPIASNETAQGGGEGPSATDDHLKNIATGMQTLLSTREFIYYSYYNRIKDKLRQYWEPKIKEKMERILRQGRTIASSSDRITRIVIILNDQGTLVKIQVVGQSGVQDLDEAAIEAFRAAAPFPNPPKGIIEQDGTIKIRWDFILEANTGKSLMDAIRLANVPGSTQTQ